MDSKFLLDTIIKKSIETEKRLAIDLSAVRQSSTSHEILNIAFIRTECNPAVCLTKFKQNGIMLRPIVDGMVDHLMEQWAILPETVNNQG